MTTKEEDGYWKVFSFRKGRDKAEKKVFNAKLGQKSQKVPKNHIKNLKAKNDQKRQMATVGLTTEGKLAFRETTWP